MFDEHVDKVLEATVKGNMVWRLQTLTMIIVRMTVKRYVPTLALRTRQQQKLTITIRN